MDRSPGQSRPSPSSGKTAEAGPCFFSTCPQPKKSLSNMQFWPPSFFTANLGSDPGSTDHIPAYPYWPGWTSLCLPLLLLEAATASVLEE